MKYYLEEYDAYYLQSGEAVVFGNMEITGGSRNADGTVTLIWREIRDFMGESRVFREGEPLVRLTDDHWQILANHSRLVDP